MKKLLYYCLSFVISSHCVSGYSQSENSDAVYLQLTKEYTLNPDASIDYRFIKKLKLLTYRSFNSLYGESSIVYNPDWQVLKINEAYTVMADGKKVITPKNALNEVLPGIAVNAPAYNNLREMIITHTGTERNAILNLDYSVHSKQGFYPALMGNELLAETEPVMELTIIIRIPNTIKLNYKSIHSDQSPVISNEGLYLVYTWKFTDIPAITQEEFQPANNEYYPRLIFSTGNDRAAVYSEFQKQTAFAFTLDDEMKKVVKEITLSLKEQKDILLKLQEKVVNEFKMWPVQLRYTGFICRTAPETWHSNGGTPVEKAILLISLLKEAGINAEPVAVVRSALFDETIGSMLDIDEFLVKAELKETGPVYLSVNTLNTQDVTYNFPERVFVEMDPSGKPKFVKTENNTNIISCKFDFTVDQKKQLTGTIAMGLVGAGNPWLQLMRDKGKEKEGFTGSIGASDQKDQRIMFTVMKESLISCSLQKEKPFRKDSNVYFFTLPVMTKGIESWGIRLLPEKRVAPVEIPSETEESYKYVFFLPEGMSSFSPDKKLEINNAAGSFHYELKTDKSKVTVKKSISLKKRIIPVSEYRYFKTVMDNWNNDNYKQIIFLE